MRGEHFVTSESHVVLLCNSIFGACGNADGIEAGFWSAICGRTPKWGNHLPENRYGNGVVQIHCKAETPTDWDLIGYTLGGLMPSRSIPVLIGNFNKPDIIRLKQCFAAMATSGDTELCHIVGLTPDAPTLQDALGHKEPEWSLELTDEMVSKAKQNICQKPCGPVGFVSLGCPHYSIDEIRTVADYIRGKKVDSRVNFQVWTSYPIKCMADVCGYAEVIRQAGGEIYTRDCPLGPLGFNDHIIRGVSGMAFDSAKQAHYMLSSVPPEIVIYYGTPFECIDAAIRGRWEA